MLEYILDSRQRVIILRLFIIRPEWIFSVPEISREVNIPKNTVARSIKPLVEYNIIREFKKGKSTVFRLNENNYVVKQIIMPLFLKEVEYPIKKASEICEALKKWIIVGVVFGSASKGNMTPTSDIDLALVSNDTKHVKKYSEDFMSAYLKEEEIIFSIHIFRLEEFKKRYAKKDPLIRNIVNGKVVFGDIDKVI